MCTCVVTIGSGKVKKARKDYDCNACDFLRDNYSDIKGLLTFTEKKAVAKARKNSFKILKGESYEWQYNVMDNETYMFKCIPEIDAICHKYDLYLEC